MVKKYCLLFLIFTMLPCFLHAQQKINGQVFDAITKEPIPFTTIKFGDSEQGMVAGLDGKFEIPAAYMNNLAYIEVSCMGYKPQKINLPESNLTIYLAPYERIMSVVEVTPPYNKIRRIINNAIANKNINNPEKYDWYRCHVYYKMIFDATLPDSILNDTGKDSREAKDFFDHQHILISETYSMRTWKKPQQLQEDVLATRFSGLKKSMFTSLVTDVLPFHSYNDYLTLYGKDYHNPVSRGFEQYYKFNLNDEIMQGGDTVWILSFSPNGHNANDLAGKVYINSNGYAISQIIARANDTMLKLNVRIEQQYELLALNDSEGRWFPKHLNYIIDWTQKSQKTEITIHMKGNSRIDSVDFKEDKDFRFDKAHTVRLENKANELSDTTWKTIRPEPLTAKEAQTYKFIDSIGEKFHADRYMSFLSKLPEGKVPVGPVDFDLKRLYSYNKYEQSRLGLGIQTNEQLIKWFSIGGWAGYGFGDKQWKYGAFAEVYEDRYKEFVFKVGYNDDINEPGRVHLDRDLERAYLKMYLLNRVDATRSYFASVKKKIGYWNLELSGGRQDIIPKYNYAFEYKGTDYITYSANEASFSFRYAYAERTAPYFGTYTRLGSRYPTWYGKITTGSIEGNNNLHIPYTQALAAALWHKHINRIGLEHFLIEGGKSWSNAPLPLGKLFAGNGFKYDSKSYLSLYSLGGLMTMYPYQYYTDRFVSFIYRHDFDWKLYKLEDKKIPFSSAPNICLQYDMLYGALNNQEAQKYVAFSIPDKAYHEVGLLLNNLFRLQYLHLFYFTLNIGYFYHITPAFDANNNGRFAFGFGIDL